MTRKTNILFFSLWLMLFAVGSTGSTKATDLRLDGPCDYILRATDIRMTAGYIKNFSLTPTVANTVSLEVWATTTPYAGVGQITGWQMGKHVFPEILSGQSQWVGVDRTDLSLTRPPPGLYSATMLLVENNVIRFWWPLDSCTFQISFNGTASWTPSGNNVRLQAQQVLNSSSGGVSGPIRLQLWALTQPGGSSGYSTATYDFPSALSVNFAFNNVDQTVPFTSPPTGTYYMSLLALEQYGTTWYTTARIDFPNPTVFGREINITGNGVTIADGDFAPVVTDHTDIGNVAVSSGTVMRTFTIQNLGTTPLTVSSIGKSGTHQADFTLGALTPAGPIPAAGSATFTVAFDPSASGLRTATLSIANDDTDEASYDFAIQGTGTEPEIAVEQPMATNIADGGSKSFGSVPVGANSSLTFTIKNTGSANLTGLTITKDGANASDFTVTANPITPVAAAGSTTFTVHFAPGATGTRTASIHIANNDADENPFDITLNGTGTAPEMNLLGNNVNIVDGDLLPAWADHTHIGNVTVSVGTVVRTFTIQNLGTAPLTVSNIGKSGTHQADFTLGVLTPAGPIPVAGSATFTVTFDPSASGLRTAALSIVNNDANETPYDFAIQGNGIVPEITVEQPAATNITDGASKSFGSVLVGANTSLTFTIKNTGSANLNGLTITKDGVNAADFTVTANPVAPVAAAGNTTFTVRFAPTATGTRTAAIHIANNDVDENPFDITLNGTGTAPEMNLLGNSVSIVDGDLLPAMADHTHFGNVAVSGGTVVRTFTIQNLGTAPLAISSIGKSGTHQADFTLGAMTPAGPIPAAGLATFAVTFNPSASGLRTAALSIVNNDANETPYNFAIQGTGTAPEIAVEQPAATNIADGTSKSFGSVMVGANASLTFTIKNTGSAYLTGLTITKDGTHAADFTVTVNPVAPVAAAGSTTFTVRFAPTATGTRTAAIHIANNDADENPFDITLNGNGTAPEIDLLGNAVSILDGDATPALTDHTDFGSKATSSGTVVRTFTIKNTGTATLSLTGVTRVVVGGTNAADFKVTTLPPASVASLGTTTFQVTFDPSASGVRTATLSIANNDANENPYNFSIKGTGTTTSPILAAGFALTSSAPSVLQTTTGIKWIDGQKYLYLAVRKPAGDLNFRHRVEVSQNLLDWFSGKNHTSVLQDDEEWLRVRDNTPLSPGTKRFIRLKSCAIGTFPHEEPNDD